MQMNTAVSRLVLGLPRLRLLSTLRCGVSRGVACRKPLTSSVESCRPQLLNNFKSRFHSLLPAAATSMAETETEKPVTIYRKDYKPTPYLVDAVSLSFYLEEDVTTVTSVLNMVPNYGSGAPPPVVFDGRADVSLESVKVQGESWSQEQYTLTPKELTLEGLPEGSFKLEIVTKIKPQENTSFEGLYKSSGNYCTQCEANGFRGITYFYDRPDVMSKYTVRIEGDREKYPVLLSNGNLEESGDVEGGRHYALWVDPFNKPCYLFALVAGDLAVSKSTFTTVSGRTVNLRIYAQHHNIKKVDYAMQALKDSMKWDEEEFGREYDLDIFNIVAVDDFNMGAMENKSLNVFNSKYVLASSETATDIDFYNIQGVVGHEYFHNWTGNRVTCKDWFQLTLKEGLTVYRDQEFTSDLNSRAVKRIDDASTIRASQFTEDAGPMAHPIRPDSYIKMDNFYTITVYEKGAEIIRLYRTILGKEGFRKGMDLYFERHDGQAVSCDDFRAALADANKKDLSTLGRWYSQAGTPTLSVSGTFDDTNGTYTLKAKQETPPTKGQDVKEPVLVPIAIGFVGPDGKDLPIKLKGSSAASCETLVLEFDTEEAEYVIEGVTSKAVPSILRNFSAPVKLEIEGQTDEDLLFLFGNDSDPFNRWDAGQRIYKKALKGLYQACMDSSEGSIRDRCLAAGGLSDNFVEAFRSVLTDTGIDGEFAVLATGLPSESELIDEAEETDPVVLQRVYQFVKFELATKLKDVFAEIVKRNDSQPGEKHSMDVVGRGKRALKNLGLAYLAKLKDNDTNADLLRRTREATNMTDTVAALKALPDCPEREVALKEFYEKWKEDFLVCLKWLSIQAMSEIEGNFSTVRALVDHPAYNPSNPNCNYSLLRAFTFSAINFHNEDGSGYEFYVQEVAKLDKKNPQVAGRLFTVFAPWRKLDKGRQGIIKKIFQDLLDSGELSDNSFEVASNTLA